jgi:type II secretory pathway component GspD/PulD (secretin)
MKKPSGIAFVTIFLMMLAGCAPGPLDSTPELVRNEAPPAEVYLEEAAALYQEGSYDESAELVRAALRSATAYRIMPELLYLLSESELALGNRERAAPSLNLLKTYYPRRWFALPEVDALDAIVEEAGPWWGRRGSGHALESGGWSGVWRSERSGSGDAGVSGSDDSRRDTSVTNVFYETDILQVLADISAQVGIPIAAAQGVRGYVTIEFDDLPLEDCLRRLVLPLGLGYAWMDGYYLVGAADPREAASVLLTETMEVRPRHLLARDALKLLPQSYERYVRVDGAGGNTLTVTGPHEILRSFLRDLAVIDRPPRQVMIEALVIEVNRDATLEWGIDWEVIGSKGGDSFRIAKLASAVTDSSFIAQLFSIGVDGLGSVTRIQAAVRALEAAGGARVRANPRVATIDGQEAKIRVGTEAYYSLLSGSVSYAYYTLQKIATGTTLEITPYIVASSEIVTDISIEVSDVRAAGTNDLPVTSVREVETRARVGNGESVMIGGLLLERERTKENRVPFLGRIPLLGALFGYTSVEKGQTEMFVLVTPHIMIHPTELAALLE